MRKLVMNQMESFVGGDNIDVYCYSKNGFRRVDAMICIAEVRSGLPESGTHMTVDPLIVGCAAGGILAILLGLLNPVLGRVASIGVIAGCTIAKIGASN